VALNLPIPPSRGQRACWAGPRLSGAGLALLVLGLAGPAPADSPGRSERVLAGLSSSDPSRRRAAVGDLAGAAREEPQLSARALPALKEILRVRGPEERAEVARALAGITHPDVERQWLALALDDTQDQRVLAAAIEGLTPRGDGEPLALRLLEASNDKALRSTQRALALEALGALGGGAAHLRLGLERPGADWVEESGRALGLGRHGGPASISRLIELLGSEESCPRTHAWEELLRLTKQAWPAEQAPWEAWWRAEQAKAGKPVPPAPPGALDPDGRYARPEGRFVPRYYGVPIPQKSAITRVVFCCDVSQSMYGFPLDRSRKELAKTLKELPSSYRFDVIGFNENVLAWAGRLVRAHPVQKVRALDWFLALEPTSYTNIYDAVELGLGYAGRGRKKQDPPETLDALFLLTDGEPNRGRYRQPDELVREIAELAQPGIPVHTIGAGTAAYDLLKRIAAATGGTFTDAFE